MKYKISQDEPTTIRDSRPYRDYVSFDLFTRIIGVEDDAVVVGFKISRTFFAKNKVDANIIQKILIKKVTDYFSRNDWETDVTTLKTKVICSDNSNPEGIEIRDIAAFRELALERFLQ